MPDTRFVSLPLTPDVAPFDLDTIGRAAMNAALAQTGGNQKAAAALCGVSPRVFSYKMQTHGLPRPMADRRRRAHAAVPDRVAAE